MAYAGRPTVSVLLEYFKRPHTLGPIVTNLKQSCASASVPCELVVNVDNPHEAGEWARVAAQHPGFVVPVFSANVHEVGWAMLVKSCVEEVAHMWVKLRAAGL